MHTEVDGVVSRRWPLTIKNYFFGQRPSETKLPDIARLISIPAPVENAVNLESCTLLTNLSESEEELISRLTKDTRKQIRRAQREGITIERLDCRNPKVLDDFNLFWVRFVESKADAREALDVSVQFHMLHRLAQASLLDMSRALGPQGEPLVYHVFIVAEGRARVLHSASLFRDVGQNSFDRHFMAWANRFLHWQNMLYYKRIGYIYYDMGGWYAGRDDASLLRVNQFKEEFGGKVVREYDAIYGCTTKGKYFLPFRDLYIRIRDGISGMTSR